MTFFSLFRHYDKKDEDETSPEFDKKEYYLQKEFKSTEEALALFKDDELMSKPGKFTILVVGKKGGGAELSPGSYLVLIKLNSKKIDVGSISIMN